MNKEPLAKTICETLTKQGYTAYYAGGYVRDKLLDTPNEDIDIATSAPPEVVQSLFSKTLPIGISFGIVVVIIEGHPFEVATFRKDLGYQDGRRPTSVHYCSASEDAKRRDFTINGLFFDPIKEEIFDFVDGQKDLKAQQIRAIGDPSQRFSEDRLRMIRAVRFSARFDFPIEQNTWEAMKLHSCDLLPAVSIERVYQEFEKMRTHQFSKSLKLLYQAQLLQVIFPSLETLTDELLSERLKIIDKLPKNCPTLLALAQLFDDTNESLVNTLADDLKVSKREAQLSRDCLKAKETLTGHPTRFDWVCWISHNHWDIIYPIVQATVQDDQKERLTTLFETAKKDLSTHIQRKCLRKPLVQSNDLMKHGIAPGKQMGELLKEAEKIVIEKNFENPLDAIQLLKKTALWQNSQ